MAYAEERFSNPTGSGLQNGLTPADAWSLTDAIANVTSGQLLKHTGDVTLPAQQFSFNQTGAGGTAPMGWYGYDSDPGGVGETTDLTYDRDPITGELPDNYPRITLTHNGADQILVPTNCDWSFLEFYTNSLTGNNAVIGNSGTLGDIAGVKVILESDARLINFSNANKNMTNCDLLTSGTSDRSVTASRCNITHCYFEKTGSYVAGAIAVRNAGARMANVINCIFRNFGSATNYTSVTSCLFSGCTFYDCGTICISDDSSANYSVVNCVAWCDHAFGRRFFEASANRHLTVLSSTWGGFADMTLPTVIPDKDSLFPSVSPFVGVNDLHLNDTPGGGLESQNSGVWNDDRGALENTDGGGSGPSFSRVANMAGGFAQ